MTRIDFYILSESHTANRDVIAAKLTEKAYKLGHKVFIHTPTQMRAQAFDDFLWTFRDGSFVPHCVEGHENDRFAPVQIGAGSEPHSEKDLLINLGDEVPLFFSQFQRAAEIVGPRPEEKDLGRQRFKFYKDRGYQLDVHKLP